LYIIEVGNTVSELLAIISTRNFADESEFDDLITNFVNNTIETVKTKTEEKIIRIEFLKQTNEKIALKKECEETLEAIDAIVLRRRLYLDEKVIKKYKYRGRYNYANPKRNPRGNKDGYDKRIETSEQLCVMFKDQK